MKDDHWITVLAYEGGKKEKKPPKPPLNSQRLSMITETVSSY